jgi:hypothetical protein
MRTIRISIGILLSVQCMMLAVSGTVRARRDSFGYGHERHDRDRSSWLRSRGGHGHDAEYLLAVDLQTYLKVSK